MRAGKGITGTRARGADIASLRLAHDGVNPVAGVRANRSTRSVAIEVRARCTFDRGIRAALAEAGCRFVRPGKGSREIW